MSQRICSVLDCDAAVSATGLCSRHYRNKRYYGHLEPVRDWPLITRLTHTGWDVTDRGCWEWRGPRSEKGYGLLHAPRLSLDGVRVHRVIWEMHNTRTIPEDHVIRHRCDNPPCVNPDHLELGTVAENQADMVARGRSIAYSTGRYDGVCLSGEHDVTQPGALRLMGSKKKKYMGCVACNRERQRRYREKRKAS